MSIIDMTKHIDHINAICKDKNLNVTIFTFMYEGVNYKCFYSIGGEVIIIAAEGYNIAFDILIRDKRLDNYLEQDVYLTLKQIHKAKLRTKVFCDNLLNEIINLTSDVLLNINNESYNTSRGNIKDYDENERVYFYCWSRSYCSRKPTKKNLKKTKMFFGEEIYLICKLNNISSRWKGKSKQLK